MQRTKKRALDPKRPWAALGGASWLVAPRSHAVTLLLHAPAGHLDAHRSPSRLHAFGVSAPLTGHLPVPLDCVCAESAQSTTCARQTDSVSPSLVSCTAAAVSDSLWEPSLPALLAALLSLFGIQTRLVRPRCASVPLQGLAQLPLYKMFYFHFKSGSTRNCPM